ncbi:MAG: response regulator transcription factor [Rhodobacteraceae bacterium]|nr:response regulator transcription factor [Paracoccaceae bacterium]
MSLVDNEHDLATTRRSGGRVVAFGLASIVGILAVAAVLLFMNLPTATAFVDRVDTIFFNYDLTSADSDAETKLLGILADSGASFSEVLASYRVIIFVLLIFATALLIASLVFLITIIALNRRVGEIERSGIQVSSLIISRDERKVYLNNMEFALTAAAIETLAVLAEARMDEDVLSGAEIEAVISGKSSVDCDEASGATRIKRLRDTLGNQMVSELLIKNIARKGYMLSIDKDVIRMI